AGFDLILAQETEIF
ncbi:unnamed protein product, partial [Rotaria sordida]